MTHIEGDKKRGTMLGVAGTWQHAKLTPLLWYNQVFKTDARTMPGDPKTKVRAEIRFDDRCRNGHNTFSVCGETFELLDHSPSGLPCAPRWFEASGGQVTGEIAAAFPELAHLLKWHLVSDDGPLHYIANTVYHAGDRDHRGLRLGEERPLTGPKGNTFRELMAANEPGIMDDSKVWDSYRGDRYVPLMTLRKSAPGEGPSPNPPTLVWRTQMVKGEGKARELDHARSSAVWPEATDEQLTQEPAALKAMLEARHPQLMAAFFDTVVAAGFILTPSATPASTYE